MPVGVFNMGVFSIPLRKDQARFDFTVVLDGVAYLFLFSWNSRDSAWYMSLFTEDETPICLGVKVVVNWPLCYRTRSPLKPPGLLMAFDQASQGVNPGLEDLGGRVRLLYFDADSVAEMRAA